MSELLAELAAALRERHAIIADEEGRREVTAHMDRLQKISERLEEIEQRLPAATPSQLRHFLQRRSYSKALDFIDALLSNP